jgi:uncharacterized membrane protein YcaP (DUF421 family)
MDVVVRSLIVYLVGLAAIRVGKSRLMSQSTPFDLLLALILGTILGQGISGSLTLTGSLAATLTVVASHWLLSWIAFRSHWFGNLVKGHCYPLVSGGAIDWNNMRRALLTENDLLEALRLNGNIGELEQVEQAFKERSGAIGVVPRKSVPCVLDIKLADGVQTVRLVFTEAR